MAGARQPRGEGGQTESVENDQKGIFGHGERLDLIFKVMRSRLKEFDPSLTHSTHICGIFLRNTQIHPKSLPTSQDATGRFGEPPGTLSSKPLVSQKFRRAMTDPRPHSRGGKNPGFWIQTEARGDCLALVLTLHLSLLEPPPRHHFHLITGPPTPASISPLSLLAPSPVTILCPPNPGLDGPLGIEGQREWGGFGNVGEGGVWVGWVCEVSASLASDAKIHSLNSNNGWS